MEHFISRHAMEVVESMGYDKAVAIGEVRLLVADEDGYDAVLTEHELAELTVGMTTEAEPTAIWQPDMCSWDPPASYRSPPHEWQE